ncbi:MAG TPA: tetratricopeptide repeat protein [Verrucomicrobiae bacterium]|jgi:tetratricopeptide (TPR) repeat protein|nr:tetratricopeptide repeat protein [Verrucomicrobiae bacterium]
MMRTGSLALIISILFAGGIAEAQHSIGRVGCPQCVNDGSEISNLLQQADSLYAAFRTREALQALSRVLQLDPENFEATAKSSRGYIDLGDMIPETDPATREQKLKEYRTAEEYARKAVKLDPQNTWGHFYVAASLGKIASLSSVSKQIDLAGEIRAEIEKSLEDDPQNGFAYHVYGIWHRKMAEVGHTSRMLASTFLWRSVPKGDLNTSVEYFKKAIALNPKVVAHHLELAKTYISLGKYDLARASLKTSLAQPIKFSDDANHKKEAEKLLKDISDR